MKTFSTKGKAESTTFHKVDLLALERLLTEESEDGLHIFQITLYFEEGQIKIDTFAELEDEEYLSFQNNPTKVSVSAHGSKDGQLWKSAYVDIWKSLTEFHVHEDDQTWVFGLGKQLQRFFDTKKKWDFTVITMIVLALLSGVLAFSGINALFDNRSVRASAFLVLWLMTAGSGIYFSWWSIFRGPSRIYLKDKPARRVDYQLWATVGSTLITVVVGYLIAKYVE